MPKVSQIYTSNSDWLRAADLSGPANVTILAVEMTSFDDKDTGKRKDQLALAFDGWDKKLGLNATNASRIAQLLGDDTDFWTNHTITLYVEQNVKGPNGMGPAIRVMPMLPGRGHGVPAQPQPAPAARPQPSFPPAPHVATGNIVQRQQQRRASPPPVQSSDDYGADYDPLA